MAGAALLRLERAAVHGHDYVGKERLMLRIRSWAQCFVSFTFGLQLVLLLSAVGPGYARAHCLNGDAGSNSHFDPNCHTNDGRAGRFGCQLVDVSPAVRAAHGLVLGALVLGEIAKDLLAHLLFERAVFIGGCVHMVAGRNTPVASACDDLPLTSPRAKSMI